MKLAAVLLLSFAAIAAFAQDDPCRGKIQDYVSAGNTGMTSTETAEHLACRDSDEFRRLQLTKSGGVTLVENAVISATVLRTIVGSGDRIEFRRCRFPEAVDLSGDIHSALLFHSCEFQGSIAIRYATITAAVTFIDCLFHQELVVEQTKISEGLSINGCVATSPVTLENVTLTNGLHVTGTRFVRGLISKDVRSPAGFTFENSRWLARTTTTDLDLQGGIRFHDCAWDRTAVVEFVRGSVAGGIRFDACSFDGQWNTSTDTDPAHVKLTDLTLGSAFVLADSSSIRFPRLRVSRSVIPFIKLPEWRIAEKMIQQSSAPVTDLRELEDAAELLQLLRIGYEREGRTRDADAVRLRYELLVARIRGGPAKYLRIIASHFGTGAAWAFGVMLSFSAIVFTHGVVREHSGTSPIKLIGRSIYTSVVSFISGPPAVMEQSVSMLWLLRFERLLGILFFFVLGLAVNDWLHV